MRVTILFAACFYSLVFLTQISASDHAPPPEHGAPEHGSSEPTKPKKQSLKPFSKDGLDQCERPEDPTAEELGCGTREYDEYVGAVDAYNNCIKPVENVQMISLQPCKEVRRKKSAKSRHHSAGRKTRGRRHILDSPATHK